MAPKDGTKIQWEWKLNPQIIVSAANFIVLFVGVLGLWFKMQADVSTAKDAVTELRNAFTAAAATQNETNGRLIKVETKVDLMGPMLQRIEANQLQLRPDLNKR